MGICMIFGAGERVPKERIETTGCDSVKMTPCQTDLQTECISDGIRCDGKDLVIAADGGMDWIREELTFLKPDIFIGDMDSLSENVGAEVTEDDPKRNEQDMTVFKLPVEKDDTDMGAAVKIGLERGYKMFYLYGGTGGRWDHTIANLQLLKHIALSGGTGFLIGPGLTATVVHADGCGSRTICLSGRGKAGRPFSLFGMGTAEGVTISGAKYEANGVTLADDYALGVSNETKGENARIRFSKGTLLIVGDFLPCDIFLDSIE